MFRLHAPDGSEFLFGADSEEQQEEWVRKRLLKNFFVFLVDLTEVVSGEEDQVPRGVAAKPTAHQLQGFR